MTNEKVKDQEVKEEKTFNDADGNPSCEGSSCANVADEEQTSADNVAEGEAEESAAEAEPSQEEIIAVWRDKYMRLQAEFDNYRKRTMKEKAELIKNGGERTIESILPVLDDFERALNTMEKSENAAEIRTGVELIYTKFVNILKQNGLQKIETEGADFDTDFHEAIAMVPTPEASLKGKVLDCIQTGYILNDKVIRHAKVAVGE